jgi:hypothetical protein
MANTQQKLDAAKACFDYNKAAIECYVTGDLTVFFNKNHAANHAAGLEVKTIDHFTRSADAQVAEPVEETPAEPVEEPGHEDAIKHIVEEIVDEVEHVLHIGKGGKK